MAEVVMVVEERAVGTVVVVQGVVKAVAEDCGCRNRRNLFRAHKCGIMSPNHHHRKCHHSRRSKCLYMLHPRWQARS